MRCIHTFVSYLFLGISFSFAIASCRCAIVIVPHMRERTHKREGGMEKTSLDGGEKAIPKDRGLGDGSEREDTPKEHPADKASSNFLPVCSDQVISRKLIFHKGEVHVVVGATNFVITSSYGGDIRKWSLSEGGEVPKKTLDFNVNAYGDSIGRVHSLALSSDERVLLSGADRSYNEWNIKDGDSMGGGSVGTPQYKIPVMSVAYSPILHPYNNNTRWAVMHLYDIKTDTHEQTSVKLIGEVLPGGTGSEHLGHLAQYEHQKVVRSMVVHPDGKSMATGSADMSILLWDVSMLKKGDNINIGKKVASLMSSQQGPLHSIAYSPDGKYIAAASENRNIILWDVVKRSPLRYFRGHTNAVYSVAFSPDGKTLISGSKDQSIKVWDVETGKVKRTLIGHTGAVYSVAFFHNGEGIVSGSADKNARLWFCWK